MSQMPRHVVVKQYHSLFLYPAYIFGEVFIFICLQNIETKISLSVGQLTNNHIALKFSKLENEEIVLAMSV